MKCGDQTYEYQIDFKVDQLMDVLQKQSEKADELVVSFFHTPSTLQQSFFAGAGKKELWEQWVIPVKLLPQ